MSKRINAGRWDRTREKLDAAHAVSSRRDPGARVDSAILFRHAPVHGSRLREICHPPLTGGAGCVLVCVLQGRV